jgi:hypothetical protein
MARFVILVSLGMATFAMLGAAFKPIRIEGADLLRKAPSFWDGSQVLNGPVFGLYASVGMVLLPLVFFRGRKMVHTGVVEALLAGLAGSIGLAANLLFQNRSPMLALGLSLIWVSGYLLWRAGAEGPGIRRVAILRMAWLGGGLACLGWLFQTQVQLALFRFQTVGLGTNGRAEAWRSVMTHLFDQPFGGRHYNLAGLSFAHNLWFDVANDSGLVSVLLLNVLIGIHIIYVHRAFQRTAGFDLLVLMAMLLSLGVGAALEPLLIGSPTHFAMLMMMFGWSVALGTGPTPGNGLPKTEGRFSIA